MNDEIEDRKMGFIQHLEELRKRIIISILAVGVGSLFSYIFADEILNFLSRPVGELVFISITEAFLVKLKVSIVSGVFIASPLILYQIWRFVAPGLYRHERKSVFPIVLSSYILFLLGAFFAYLVLPISIKFLLGFGTENIKPMLSVSGYISFAAWLILAIGVVFELPLVILFLVRIGILTPTTLSKNRKYVILGLFIIAAIVTPPDVVSQFLIAIPLLVLYELSYHLSKLIKPKEREGG